MYHFLSGFTAKVAGTEKGLGKEPQPTFSTCFGAPFMPRHPSEYGNLLRDLIALHKADCWLVNTGWTGGAYGTGSRMPIKATRALLAAALDGTLANVEMRVDPHFRFRVPSRLRASMRKFSIRATPGKTRRRMTRRRRSWSPCSARISKKFEAHVGPDVLSAAPQLAEAAE